MKTMLKACGRVVRDGLLAAAAAMERVGGTQAGAAAGPFEGVNRAQIGALVQAKPGWWLQIREVRRLLAEARAPLLAAKGIKKVGAPTPAVAHNTLDYNLQGAIDMPHMDRPNIMVGVVLGIEKLWKNVAGLDVLSIGPRSEAEIFALYGAGFAPSRVKALDLFSYSPFVDLGDMHAMPYPDNSFDVVFVGWVLSYSKDQAAAAREYLRVTRPGGVIVLAGDYSDEEGSHLEGGRDREATFHSETTHMQSCDQILALFAGSVGAVYFRHEAALPDIRTVMTVFEVRK